MTVQGSSSGGYEAVPALKSLHPAASRWIGALARMRSPHPALTRILDVVERLQERPYRTNFVLLGEPGTGKEGLARALAHLSSSGGGALVRFDAAGFSEDDALDLLCGGARRTSLAEAADGGAILIEEVAELGPRVQAALLRLLKTGRVERARFGTALDDEEERGPAARAKRLKLSVIAMSDRDLMSEVATGRFRHDLYYRLARVQLWLPPLRERVEDIGPAAIWMGNRILESAGIQMELATPEDLARATSDERVRSIVLDATAVRALEAHPWPGNFRELEAVMERALLLYRRADQLSAAEIGAALAAGTKT